MTYNNYVIRGTLSHNYCKTDLNVKINNNFWEN